MKQSNIQELIEKLENGDYDYRLKEIYVDKTMILNQRERYIKALKEFQVLFGDIEVEIYSAPGRSEVCGNHTDHQQGSVLATSINVDAIAVVSKRKDNKISVLSEGYEMITIDLQELSYKSEEEGTSIGLIRGMAFGMQQAGFKVEGFNAYVTSDVLGGAGLSSSAAFEVLIGTILSGLYNGMNVDSVKIAQIAQFSENKYFGKPCGLMDQMASSVGGLIHIDFRDASEPIINKVNVDFEEYGYSLCITDTKGSHADLTDEYAAVPSEMKEVANYFGKEVLSEVDKEEFYEDIANVRAKIGDRNILRAIHFFEDTNRVEKEVSALQEGDIQEFLRLVKQSGDYSFKYLQNVYSVKDVKKQEVAVGLAISETILENHGVSRVHGGGFAGTIQAFVEDSFVQEYKLNMDNIFGQESCQILKIRPFGGIKVL